MRFGGVHRVVWWGLVLALLSMVPLIISNTYYLYLMDLICIMIILSVGLNIVKGFAGQVTVGHVGLYAIGAYVSAVLTLNFGFNFWGAVPVAVFVACLAGAVVGIPSFRLEGAYLALATLGMSESIRIFIHVTEYLGASQGLGGIPAPNFFGIVLDTYHRYYFLVMPSMLIAVYVSIAILRSSIGRAFKAVREDPLSAAAIGIDVKRYKLLAFMLSAIYAGFAGSLLAHMSPGYIHPNNFTVIEMVTLLLMVVIGGIGHLAGGIIGAIIVTIIFDLTRDLYFYQMLIFGSVIVVTVLFMPKGFGGLIEGYLSRKKFVEAAARTREKKFGNAA